MSKLPLAYIASPSYSGSTLLTLLLHAHPEIATVGELKWGEIDLEIYACSCGALLRACPFWRQVSDEMAKRELPFNLQRPPTDFRLREDPVSDRIARARVRGAAFEQIRSGLIATLPGPRRTWPRVAAVNRALIEIILSLENGRVFVDASKDPVRLKHLLDTGDYDVRIIQLVRDGRGVVNSAIKNEGVTAEHAAREWERTHEQIERLGARFGPDRLLSVRYEDLCRDIKGTLRSIHTFLGLSDTGQPPTTPRQHHVLGNRMRLQPIREIRVDEKWRAMLPDAALADFQSIGGKRNDRFGYV